jgi:hypothetical protein
VSSTFGGGSPIEPQRILCITYSFSGLFVMGGEIVNCPKCGESLQSGQLVLGGSEGRGLGDYAALWFFGIRIERIPAAMYFEPSGGGERTPLSGPERQSLAHLCPNCKTVVLSPDPEDPTREEMVGRWQKLTGESPLK